MQQRHHRPMQLGTHIDNSPSEGRHSGILCTSFPRA